MNKPTSMNVLKTRLIKDLMRCGESINLAVKAVDNPWDITTEDVKDINEAYKRFEIVKKNAENILKDS